MDVKGLIKILQSMPQDLPVANVDWSTQAFGSEPEVVVTQCRMKTPGFGANWEFTDCVSLTGGFEL